MLKFKEKFGDIWIRWRLRTGRGATYTQDIQGVITGLAQGGVILIVLKDLTGRNIPFEAVIFLYVFQKTLEYVLGLWDEKRLHFWSRESEYASRRINPYDQEVLERIKNIEKIVNNEPEKP